MDKKFNKRIVIQNFVDEKHSLLFRDYWDTFSSLCSDNRPEHSHRNLHFNKIKDIQVRTHLTYYQQKLKFFIDHFFQTKVKPWNDPQICRWRAGEYMGLHGDNENGIDKVDYSAIIYLNDNYDGGSLIFESKETYKVKKNGVIFFESGIHNRHRVSKIIKGYRYTIPLWFRFI